MTRPHPSPTVEYIRRHNLVQRKHSEVEQAKKTGGMVALFPRKHDAEKILIVGGEEEKELHMTVVFLGEDVRDQDPSELISQLDYISNNYNAIDANVFAHAAFNPAGDEPCSVYLIGGNPDITRLHDDLKQFVGLRYPGSKEQHSPYVPHVTAGYGIAVGQLDYTGPITFDRIGLRWPEHDQDWTL